MRDFILYACGAVTALAAAGLVYVIGWLNRRGLEVIHVDIPDHVPAYLIELVARGD